MPAETRLKKIWHGVFSFVEKKKVCAKDWRILIFISLHWQILIFISKWMASSPSFKLIALAGVKDLKTPKLGGVKLGWTRCLSQAVSPALEMTSHILLHFYSMGSSICSILRVLTTACGRNPMAVGFFPLFQFSENPLYFSKHQLDAFVH